MPIYDPVDVVSDPARLDALLQTALLDSPTEEAFDRLTRLATRLLDVPVALVSLVDCDRQFFKSCIGLPEPWASARETPLSHSFCQHAVALGEPLVVEDARTHPLVKDNLAVPELGVVAYAGIPLITSQGHALGSFCAIDGQPRSWTEEEITMLRDLATSVVTEIELRIAVRQAEAKARQAEEAARIRDEIVAIVSHDLRDPLNTIVLSTGLMLDILPPDESREADRRQLAIIKRAADRMNRLIADLLDIAKLEAGRLAVESDTLSPDLLLLEAVEVFQPVVEESGLQLASRFEKSLPEIEADRERLLQVLSNLVGNAVKFTPAGGQITIEARADPGEIVFSVADTGSGIDPEHLPRLFDRFWQAHREDQRGAGLGLAIVKGIVDAHGGRTWVESRVGEGSTFYFTIPTAATGEDRR